TEQKSFLIPESQVRNRLAGGGKRIRTIGPSCARGDSRHSPLTSSCKSSLAQAPSDLNRDVRDPKSARGRPTEIGLLCRKSRIVRSRCGTAGWTDGSKSWDGRPSA